MDTVVPQPRKLVRRGATGYQPPPLPWTLEPASLAELARMAPGIVDVPDIQPPSGRGLAGWLAPRLRHVPVLRNWRPVIAALRFG